MNTFNNEFFRFKNRNSKLYFPNENKEISFEDFEFETFKAVNFLKYLNLKKNDKLIIYGETSFYYMVFIFACAKIGITSILISEKYNIFEMEKVLNLFDKFYIMDISSEFKFEQLKIHANYKLLLNKNIKDYFIYSKTIGENKIKSGYLEIYNFRCILLTSGTTGTIKPIEWSFKDICKQINYKKEQINFDNNDIALISTPIYHIASLSAFLTFFLNGCNIILLKNFSASTCINLFDNIKPSILFGVPSVYFSLINKLKSLDKKIHLLSAICVGDILDNNLLKGIFYYMKANYIYDDYGMTEVGNVCLKEYTIENSEIKINKAYINTYSVKLDTSNPIFIKESLHYEILVKKEKENSYLKTGDIGYFSNDILFITGRKKFIIVKGGENISPVFLTEVLKKYLQLSNVIIFGISDEFYGQDICICIESQLNKNTLQEQVIKTISKYLSKIYLPKEIIVFNKMPLRPSGKIDINKIKGFTEKYENVNKMFKRNIK